MKSVRPLCFAAALAALLLASAGPAAADDGIHHLWKGLSSIGAPVFEMIESFWGYLTGTGTAQSGTATEKDVASGTSLDPESTITADTPPPPGGGCVDPLGCPNPKP